jgi:hypothetical protein
MKFSGRKLIREESKFPQNFLWILKKFKKPLLVCPLNSKFLPYTVCIKNLRIIPLPGSQRKPYARKWSKNCDQKGYKSKQN